MSHICNWQIQPSLHALLPTSCVPTTAVSTTPTCVMEIKTAWMALMRKTVVGITITSLLVGFCFIYVVHLCKTEHLLIEPNRFIVRFWNQKPLSSGKWVRFDFSVLFPLIFLLSTLRVFLCLLWVCLCQWGPVCQFKISVWWSVWLQGPFWWARLS